MEYEQSLVCPTCWQEITVLLDLSVRDQTYVQDCEVCCNPIEISFSARDGVVERFEAKRLDA